MGAGKKWTSAETVVARGVYVTASAYPRKGRNKNRDVFFAELLHFYEKEVESIIRDILIQKRTGAAVAQFYGKGCECLKLEGSLQRIKSRKPTGSPTKDEIERGALVVYNGEEIYLTCIRFCPIRL